MIIKPNPNMFHLKNGQTVIYRLLDMGLPLFTSKIHFIWDSMRSKTVMDTKTPLSKLFHSFTGPIVACIITNTWDIDSGFSTTYLFQGIALNMTYKLYLNKDQIQINTSYFFRRYNIFLMTSVHADIVTSLKNLKN